MAASRSVAITYVPADCGSVIPGKSKAPEAFRNVGIVSKLQSAGISTVTEHQALEEHATYTAASLTPGRVRNEEANIDVCKRVQNTISGNLDPSTTSPPPFQLIIGGECGMLPGILTAFWHHAESHQTPRRVGLVYVDADTDLASPTDPNSTGIFAGMNMTHLTKSPGALESMAQFSRLDGQRPVCDASNTVLFGINMALPGNTRDHFAFLFDHNYKVVSSASVAHQPEERARETLRYLVEDHGVDVIVVHLDVDSIDPRLFPLANLPNYTGVAFEEMMRALRVFLSCDRVAGLVVAEVNPDHDPKLEMTERLTDHIVEMLASRTGVTT